MYKNHTPNLLLVIVLPLPVIFNSFDDLNDNIL